MCLCVSAQKCCHGCDDFFRVIQALHRFFAAGAGNEGHTVIVEEDPGLTIIQVLKCFQGQLPFESAFRCSRYFLSCGGFHTRENHRAAGKDQRQEK